MKYTLNSQEYNEMFRSASETFDQELIKRDLAIKNMNKKLMIIDYANEFMERKLNQIEESTKNNYASTSGYNSQVVSFDASYGTTYNKFGATVHPKFKKEPIDIFNLKLTTGNTMFKNSLKCIVDGRQIDDEDDEYNYVNFLIADNSIDKKIMFNEHYLNKGENKLDKALLKIEYYIDPNSKLSLGMSRFNVIEVDPYIYGAYNIDSIEIFTLSETEGIISETPIKSLGGISNIGKTRIILDEKVKFSKVTFVFDLTNVETHKNHDIIYPFGLRHIHFYEADFIEDSYVIVPIRANDYIEYIHNDITIYHAGDTLETTCDFYDIEFYTDFINNTLTGKVYTSSEAQSYRITKNTKILYAKIPLIWKNKANDSRQYLSLTGIKFNYVVDETIFL